MPWDWPVEVNQLEAAAFCRWKADQTGLPVQLPSEGSGCCYGNNWPAISRTGWRPPATSTWPASPPPARWMPAPGAASSIWWATSGSGPAPPSTASGVQGAPLYDDFSTPTFDGKHTLIKGGSWISTGNEALKSSRYAFRRHFFQHGLPATWSHAIREPVIVNPYETDTLVAQYLDFQYGPSHFGVANYAEALAGLASELCGRHERALDIGCATGRASFELARRFAHVDGVDYSARFIDVADPGKTGQLPLCGAGGRGSGGIARRASPATSSVASRAGGSTSARGCLQPQAQVRRLRPGARLQPDRPAAGARPLPAGHCSAPSQRRPAGAHQPLHLADRLHPKANWLGGIRENGEALGTYQALQRLLAEEFEAHAPRDVPFVIRETARKYQHTVAQLTVWRKR